MDEHAKLIAGCVVFIPLIAFLLLSAGKLWRGKWLGLSDLAHNPYEGRPASALQRRRGRRAALVNLVWAVACAGILGISAFGATDGFDANVGVVSGVAIPIALMAGCAWISVGSRRDGKAIAEAAAGTGPELPAEYELGTRGVALLVVIMLAVLAVEVASSLIASW